LSKSAVDKFWRENLLQKPIRNALQVPRYLQEKGATKNASDLELNPDTHRDEVHAQEKDRASEALAEHGAGTAG